MTAGDIIMRTETPRPPHTRPRRHRPAAGLAFAAALALLLLAPGPLNAMSGIPDPFAPPLEPLTPEEVAGLFEIVERGGGELVGLSIFHAFLRETLRQDLWGDIPRICDDPNCEKRKKILEKIGKLKPEEIGEPSEWDIPELTEKEKQELLDGPIKEIPDPPKKGDRRRPDVPDAKADYDCSKRPTGGLAVLLYKVRCKG